MCFIKIAIKTDCMHYFKVKKLFFLPKSNYFLYLCKLFYNKKVSFYAEFGYS